MRTASFPRTLITQLQALAQQTPELEICGLIGGIDKQATQIYPIHNVADDPKCRFLLDARQQVAAMRQMRERGEELFAIYHSHPNGSTQPSKEDIHQAAYPETLYLIISAGSGFPVQVSGYYIKQKKVEKIQITSQ